MKEPLEMKITKKGPVAIVSWQASHSDSLATWSELAINVLT